MTTTEKKEMMEDILAIFSAFIAEYFDGIDPFQIEPETALNDIGDDPKTLQEVIAELFAFYKVEKDKETFQTVGDLIQSVANQLEDN